LYALLRLACCLPHLPDEPADGVWKLWRDAPGFSQRFTGTFSDDGRTIKGRWEKSGDGAQWDHDFDLTYTKVR